MKISGFTMAKNADKLFFPWKQAIESILPIVDEFIVAVGDCDADDRSRQLIAGINSDKVKIVDTVWDINKYPQGMENAHQTDIAKSYCTGDWLFYLQADEVIHEKYLPVIKARCQELLTDTEVEGLLFGYKHFWGDFNHYHYSHKWYRNEIRIIRNDPQIHSWVSAQSFRRMPDFGGLNYRQKENTYKLKVARLDAEVFHYGWVRPPKLMRKKMLALDTIHKGMEKAEQLDRSRNFDYGPLNLLFEYKDTPPKVMKEWIAKFDWQDELQYSGKPSANRQLHKHEQLKYRLLSWFENNILGGRTISSKNYILLNK